MLPNNTVLDATFQNNTGLSASLQDSAQSGGFAASVVTDQPHIQSDISDTDTHAEADLGQILYGLAATVKIGTVQEGEEASVINSGTPSAAILDFVLPRGPQGLPGSGWSVGDGLHLDPETNVLSVDTADLVEADNSRPVTSAAVFAEVGNINALLATI